MKHFSGPHHHHQILYGPLLRGKPEFIHQIYREQSAQRKQNVCKLGRINKMLTAWRAAIIRTKTLVCRPDARQKKQMICDGIARMTHPRQHYGSVALQL